MDYVDPHRYLEIGQDGKILIIRIDNPPHNYMPSAIFDEFAACRRRISGDDVGAVIFTGKGNSFSKGADVAEIRSEQGRPDVRTIHYGNAMMNFLAGLRKPIIAAINGPCFGAGLELALACHIRVCSEKARFGLPELSIGAIPGLGGIERLVRIVGEGKATEMILLGDIISASQALDLSLVTRVFPKKDFFPKVMTYTKTILAAPQEAVEEALRLIRLSRPERMERNIGEAAGGFERLTEREGS